MKIKVFQVNPLGVNCYVVSNNNEAAIIDCGCFDEREWNVIKDYIETEQLEVRYSLLTHGHFDHICGLRFVERDYALRPQLHILDQNQYNNAPQMLKDFMGVDLNMALPKIGDYLKDGQKLPLSDISLEVIHTPGHTLGGVCFYCQSEKVVFTGDTLFCGSVGRTDLPEGDTRMEIDSLKERLLTLPTETRAMPGHGPSTTIDYERKYNPYANF